LSIRFAESEDRGDDALLLSPWPESLFAFEPMWARLAEHARLVAVDLPGYGCSERRDEVLSPRAMGEFVIRLVDALGLERPPYACRIRGVDPVRAFRWAGTEILAQSVSLELAGLAGYQPIKVGGD
jgi:hypothetical protein